MNILMRLAIAICLTVFSFTLHASCLDLRLTGVNLAGAEFGSTLPGTVFKDYVYPNSSELTYIAGKGANAIRLPFRWERLQFQAKGPLNPSELQLIQSTVAAAKAKGLCVILDVHNYGKYNSTSLAANSALQDAFVDLWLRLGATERHESNGTTDDRRCDHDRSGNPHPPTRNAHSKTKKQSHPQTPRLS